MEKPQQIYVVDTSVWINLVPFRHTLIPSLWERMDRLVTDGRLIVPEEVDRELQPTDDRPARWLHDRPQIHRSTESLWSRACEVADRYPALVNLAKPRGTADPFVVALTPSRNRRNDGPACGPLRSWS